MATDDKEEQSHVLLNREGTNRNEVKIKTPPKNRSLVGFFKVFAYSDGIDKFFMVFGTLMAILNGTAMPNTTIEFTGTIDVFFQDEIRRHNATAYKYDYVSDNWTKVQPYCWRLFYWSLVLFVSAACHQIFWKITAVRQVNRMRSLLFSHIMRQETEWFEKMDTGMLSINLTTDLINIESMMADKMAIGIQYLSTFVVGITMALSINVKLALVSMSLTPVILLSTVGVGVVMMIVARKQTQSYAIAASIATEVLSNIRTVQAFSGEYADSKRYGDNLTMARKFGIIKGLVLGLCLGIVWAGLYNIIGLSSYYGTITAGPDPAVAADFVFVIIVIITSVMALGQFMPNMEHLATAGGSANNIFDILDKESSIDPMNTKGIKCQKLQGDIEFENVDFSYPLRPGAQVLDGISLKVKAGETIALVGASGSGKSTICQLLLRLYKPDSGRISLDGVPIENYCVSSLRGSVGVVSQEPTLFNMSIADNIAIGCKTDHKVSGVDRQQVIQAAKAANAHDFIMKWPEQYDTMVGDKGSQMSGGQKQRIAIARALICDPKLLILDEATSALDGTSESQVQAAMDKASQGRTTVIVAHRLSSIRHANCIYFMNGGRITETGDHNALMARGGEYYRLVSLQHHRNPSAEGEIPEGQNQEKRSLNPTTKLAEAVEEIELTVPHSIKKVPSKTEKEMELLIESSLEKTDEKISSIFLRVLMMSKKDTVLIIVSTIGSCFAGISQPYFGLVYSGMMNNFAEISIDPEAAKESAANFSLKVFGLSIFFCFMFLISHFFFSIMGENLIRNLRIKLIEKLVRQEISWFDNSENRVSILSTRLSSDVQAILGVSGSQIGVVVQILSTFAFAFAVGFYSSWKLTLSVVVFIPMLIKSGLMHGRDIRGNMIKRTNAADKGAAIANEAIFNMRCVTSLGVEPDFVKRFDDLFFVSDKKSILSELKTGCIYGFSHSIIQFCYAVTIVFGASMVDNREIDFYIVFRVVMSIIIASLAVGRGATFAPDFARAKICARKLFTILDKKAVIDSTANTGILPEKSAGELRFEDVHFNYDSRPDVPVLRGINLCIKPGQRVALVGESGSGKSTLVSLVERFYDCKQGRLLIDGVCITDLNVHWLRQRLGLVSQEPVLFSGSIADNIAYGALCQPHHQPHCDTSGRADEGPTRAQIVEAAKMANIHDFISSLPMGYDTDVGLEGSSLSGGQKQRIAIARILIRNPDIILLDEATSALDAESEKEVQKALDAALNNRTSITIAHRLSTVKNADLICVIADGKVAEKGNHEQLMALDGQYKKLVNSQLNIAHNSYTPTSSSL